MSELQAQKAYMRQKVQQRQQEAKLQQQAAAVCLCSLSSIAPTSVSVSNARSESADLKAVRMCVISAPK